MYVVMNMEEGVMPEDAIVCLCDRTMSTCEIVHLHAKQPIEDQEQSGPRSALGHRGRRKKPNALIQINLHSAFDPV